MRIGIFRRVLGITRIVIAAMVASEHGIDMRTAAFVLAIRRVGKAALARIHLKTELPF